VARGPSKEARVEESAIRLDLVAFLSSDKES
jgi:hypothetical protein